jgi:hypothetical protein
MTLMFTTNPEPTMTMTSPIHRLAALVLAALALLAIGAAAVPAAQAAPSSPTPNHDWHVESRVINDTGYKMVLAGVDTNTCTEVERAPAQEIPIGGSTDPRWHNDCMWRGIQTKLTYDLMDTRGESVARVQAVAEANVNGWDWRGYNEGIVVFGPRVTAKWANNGGDPNHGFSASATFGWK